jgi:hypothetical protein
MKQYHCHILFIHLFSANTAFGEVIKIACTDTALFGA